jgi:outer membrane autotransporter protein
MCGYLGVDYDLKPQTADRLNVTGTASVSGAVVVDIVNPGYALPGTNTVTLVHAVGGEAHPSLELQSQPTAVATYTLTYPGYPGPAATDIDLTTTINFSPAGLTINQHSVGNAVNAIQTARNSPNFVPIAAALFYQPTVAKLGAAYDSLSGEGVAAVEQAAFNANDQFHTSIWNEAASWLFENERNDPNSQLFYAGAPLGYASADQNFVGKAPPLAVQRTDRLWMTVSGGSWRYQGDPIVGSAPVKEIGGGFSAGLDHQISPDALLGIAAGYGIFSIRVPDRATSAQVDGSHVAAHTALRDGDLYATAIVDFDYFNNTEHRSVNIPGTVLPSLFGTPIPAIAGLSALESARFASYSFSGLFETGYRLRGESGVELKPFVGVQFSDLWMNGFTEANIGSSSTSLGLSFAPRVITSLPAYVGAQVDGTMNLEDGGSLYSWIRAAWVHEFERNRSIDPSFIAAPGFDFTIYGAPPAPDLARVNTGARLNLNQTVSLNASFNADVYRTVASYSGWAGVRFGW